MNILITAYGYPDRRHNAYPFVQQLVEQFAAQGHECCVVVPYSITKNKGFYPFREEYDHLTILRPNYISFSTFSIKGFRLSSYLRGKAMKRALKQLPFKPDVVYAHFWGSGLSIYQYAKQRNLPLFVASGESQIFERFVSSRFQSFYDYVNGVVCVSTKNMDESIANGMTTADRCIVLPNGINSDLFHQKDQTLCRRRLGLPEDSFIVAFCGQMSHRKGVKVLSDALDSIHEGQPVYSLFIGQPLGEHPTCHNVLHHGSVPHNEVATYLCASDVFVLPTLHEGCSNAIVEAMACGLPVISSDRPFNYDILSEDNSILIDPTDCHQVADAIVKLRDDNVLRQQLSKGALDMAQKLSIAERAARIIEFMEKKSSKKE